MSNQNQNQFPALPQPGSIEGGEIKTGAAISVVEALKLQPQYVAEDINKNAMNFSPDVPMFASAVNDSRAVEQTLYGVIQAGGDTFGLVKVQATDRPTGTTKDGFILTKFGSDGKRAELVGGIAEGKPLTVGRNYQNDLSDETSREHFTVAFFEGKIVVGESGDTVTNGTELIRARDLEATTGPQKESTFGFKAVKRFAKRKQVTGNDATASVDNPLVDYTLWSAASHDAKEELFSMTSPTGGRYIDTEYEARRKHTVDEKDRSNGSRFFANNYNAPVDQLAAELALTDAYSSHFPESAQVLTEALNDIKSFTGMNIPKYKIVDEQLQDAQMAGMADELGFLGNPNNFGSGRSALLLKMPVEHDIPNFRELSDADQYAIEKGRDGMLAIGETLAPETKAMIEGIYELTGASVIRDALAEGDRPGRILRRGVYQGSEVYFSEVHGEGYHQGLPTLRLEIVGEQSAKRELSSPNASQRQEFAKITGVPLHDIWNIIADNNVTKDNYLDVADVLATTRQIIDGDS